MSGKAFRRFVDDVRVACEHYLATEGAPPIPIGELVGSRAAKKSTSVKGNPRCKCGHGFTVHDEPKDDADGKPQNICRGCEADGVKLGCPEFVSKRGSAIVTTSQPGTPPKQLNADGTEEFQPTHYAILSALVAQPEKTAQQVAILALYVQSGTFNSAVADLRDMGLIDGSPKLSLTVIGKRFARDIGRKYDAKTLRIAWAAKLGTLGAKIIATLYEHDELPSAGHLAALTHYVQSGTFNSMIAKMRRMGLVTKKLPLRLCGELS